MSENRHTINITSFGGLTISVQSDDGRVESISDIKGHSKKLWTLLEYLIFSGKEFVLASELIEIFWPDEASVADPLASLRLLVHRARTELNKLKVYKGSELILCQNEAYCWNRHIPTRVDTERFTSLCLAASSGNDEDELKTILDAADIYKGHFLPKALRYHWAMALDAYYHSQYISICSQGAHLLKLRGQYSDAIELCTKAVGIDPYCEALHIALIEALTAHGSYSAALEHYRSITERMLNEFGIAPSEELLATYKTISNIINAPEMDITEIRKSMTEETPLGAFYCEYELFKHIYWLKSRECIRSGQAMQLGLMTLIPKNGLQPSQRSFKTAFEKLKHIIRDSLRQGDLFTRYSVSQYLVLLQATTYENGHMVLDRIQSAFSQASPKSGLHLQSSILPMLPAAFSLDTDGT